MRSFIWFYRWSVSTDGLLDVWISVMILLFIESELISEFFFVLNFFRLYIYLLEVLIFLKEGLEEEEDDNVFMIEEER